MLPTNCGRTLLLCCAGLPLAACDIGETCTLNIVPGVEVLVRDRTTDQFLTTTPRGVVREGTFQDSLEVSGFTEDVPPRVRTLMGAEERTGRYVVHIEAEAYLPWDTVGVRVGRDDCHVHTARFTAFLDPLP
jgi:hypothetical protein